MATTYEKIQSTTLGSAAADITFSSIPSTYTDLRLVLVASTTGTSDYNCKINYNGDFSADYSRTIMNATGSTVYSGRAANQASIDWVYVLGINPIPTLITYDIFSYTGSSFKTTLIAASNSVNSGGNNTVNQTVGLWRDTSAITSVTLTASGTTFAIGSCATIYGIKAA